MSLNAGTKRPGISGEDQYANSMAAAMENAFIQEWPVIMNSDAPPPNDHMRLLFIAIAQGLIRHLKNNENAITVTVPSTEGAVEADISIEGTLY